MFQVYSPSGRFSPLFIVFLVLAAVAIAAMAFGYQLGLALVPLIYVNFLLTWAMAMAIGKAAEFVIQKGHVRNVALGLLIFAVLLLIGLAAKFGFQYLTARMQLQKNLQPMNQIDLGININRQLTPAELAEVRQSIMQDYTFLKHIELRVEDGWKVGRGGGAPVSGPFVYLVWLAELGILGYFGGATALAAVKKPYSEPLTSWASSETIEMQLPITNQAMVSKITAAKSVQELLELPIPDTDQSNKIAVYQVHSVPDSPQADAYLTVDLQTFSRNDKGELEVAHQYLVKLAVITAAQRAQLKENAELMQEALADYRASLAESPEEPSEGEEGPAKAS